MKSLAIGIGIVWLIVVLTGAPDVSAQPYCAYYNNGTTACGIPTLQSCDASLSGVGGYCGPDESSKLRPNLIERLEQKYPNEQQILHPPVPSQDQPGGLNWMPPPPQEQ